MHRQPTHRPGSGPGGAAATAHLAWGDTDACANIKTKSMPRACDTQLAADVFNVAQYKRATLVGAYIRESYNFLAIAKERLVPCKRHAYG